MLFSTNRWLPLLLILLAVWVPYSQSVYNERIGDDRVLIQDRLGPSHVASAAQLWRENYWGAFDKCGLYRPLSLSLLYAERQLFGLENTGYRFVNLTLYTLCGLLCYWFLLPLLQRTAATAAALLFVLHPAHVEVAITAYGQVEMLATAFLLLALIAHTKARPVLAALCFLAALLSKESAACFPVLAVLTRGFWLETSTTGWRRWLAPTDACYAAALALYAAAKFAVIGTLAVPATASTMAAYSLYQRLFTVFTHGLGNYIRLTLFPLSQSMAYDVFPSAIADATWLVLAALLLAALYRYLGARPVLFAALWFAATWFIFSNLVVPTGVFVAERCLFLPVLALCVLFGLLTERKPAIALLLLAAGVQSAITADAWRTEESSLRATVEEHPDSPLGRSALAIRLLTDPPVTPDRQQEAEALLTAVLARYANFPDAHRGLGLLARTRGDLPAATMHFQNALRLRPRDVLVQRELAAIQRITAQPR